MRGLVASAIMGLLSIPSGAQTEFVEPDEYICLVDENGGWTCALGREPDGATPPKPQIAEPQTWVSPAADERSFPGGSEVRPLPLPTPSEPVQLAEPVSSVSDAIEPETPTSGHASESLATSNSSTLAETNTPDDVATVTAPPPIIPPRSTSDRYWTIQVAALRDPSGVATIANELGLTRDNFEVRSEIKQGEAWTVVLLGQYASSSLAQRAASEYGLQERGWIRQVQASKSSLPSRPDSTPSAAADVERTVDTEAGSRSAEADGRRSDLMNSHHAGTALAFEALSPNRYTVQLSSVDTSSGFDQLIAEAGLSNDPHWAVEVTRQGRPWWLLLWGEFTTLTQANEAIARLPEKVKATGPWPRRVSDVLDERH